MDYTDNSDYFRDPALLQIYVINCSPLIVVNITKHSSCKDKVIKQTIEVENMCLCVIDLVQTFPW